MTRHPSTEEWRVAYQAADLFRGLAVAELVAPFATQLDLKVQVVRSLPELRKAQRELEKYALR